MEKRWILNKSAAVTFTALFLFSLPLFSQEDGYIEPEKKEEDSGEINFKLQAFGNYYHLYSDMFSYNANISDGFGYGFGFILTLSDIFDLEGSIAFDKIKAAYKHGETEYNLKFNLLHFGTRFYPYRETINFYYGLGFSGSNYTETLSNKKLYLDKEYNHSFSSIVGKIGCGYQISSKFIFEVSTGFYFNLSLNRVDMNLTNVGIIFDY